MGETKLGKYDLKTVLGKGAMGTVYEGWDPMIARRVAIKTVRLPDPSDEEAAAELGRFKREAQAAGRLTHPNIVGVFDYGETGEIAYIVMEFVDGRSLKDMIEKDERFPLPEVVRVMEGLLDGLAFSHKAGVVHRDIKPANIMITSAGQVKIADFGIARIESSSMTQAGTIMGTPAYMSPEQFMGQTVDQRTDLYSSGVVLYQMLTGERPFTGSMSAIMHKALNTEAPAPSQLSVTAPRAFDAIVKRAMARRPEDRFQSAADFAQALRGALTAPAAAAEDDDATMVATAPRPAPAPVMPATPPPPAAAGSGSRTGMIAGAAVVVVALAGGGAWFALRPGPATLPQGGASQQVAGRQDSEQPHPPPITPPPSQQGGTSSATEPPSQGPLATSPTTGQPPQTVTQGQKPALPPIADTTPPPPPNLAQNQPKPDLPPSVSPPPDTQRSTPPAVEPPAQTSVTNPPPAGQPGGPGSAGEAVTPAVTPPPAVPGPAIPNQGGSQIAMLNQPQPETAPPAKPTPAQLRDAVAQSLSGLDCSFTTSLAGTADGVELAVLAGEGAASDAVRQAVEGAAGSSAHLTLASVPAIYCPALTALAGVPVASARLDLSLASGTRALKNNEVIAAAIVGPAYPFHLQLDYVTRDDSGALALSHLAPNGYYPQHVASPGARATYGEPIKAKKFPGYTVGPPFGTDLIIGIASAAPLFPKDPEDGEPAESYFKRLAEAIRAAGPAVAVQVIEVNTKDK